MTSQQYSHLTKIFDQFRINTNRDELLKIWQKNKDQLADCRLIVANPDGDPFNLKKKFDHPSLKLQLAGENFWFINNLSNYYHNVGWVQPTSIDPCIVLDTNLVVRIHGFLNKNLKEDINSQDILRFVASKPFYYGFYAIEEYETYIAGQQHEQIKKKLKAVHLFENIDLGKYQASNGNEIQFKISQSEAELWAENKFMEIFSRTSLPYFSNLKNAIYLLLLKVCEIEFAERIRYPTPIAKILELYTFMHNILFRLFGKEAHLITLFFEDHKKINKNLSFFAPIQKSNKGLLRSLKGMAADLTLIQFLERIPDTSNRADILVPFLISRDERLNSLLALLPKISKLFFYTKVKGENCMSEWENESLITQGMREKSYWEHIKWFYDEPFWIERIRRQHEDQKIRHLEFKDEVEELEEVVLNLT